jgi:putative FmdB family regulatory protein
MSQHRPEIETAAGGRSRVADFVLRLPGPWPSYLYRGKYMPTYDYVCDHCEHQFELFQGISEPVMRKCPECGKQKLRRLIGTGAAILFKGSGFYTTDYRSDAYKKAAEADHKASTGDAGASSKAESGAKTESGAKSRESSKKHGKE